jgi:tetratricopeptide (TPR) repeat protein
MFDAVSALLAAISHQRAGRLEAAEGLLRDVLAHDKDEPSALFLLGSTLLGLGRADEAVAPLTEAVAIRPNHREQRQALARALLTAARPADALAVLAPLAAETGLAEVQFLRGTALNALNRPREGASALLDAIAAAPAHAAAHLNLGNALADLDDHAAAEAHMRRAIALHPDLPEAHASLGFLLTGRGELAAAAAACQRAIDLQPEFAVAHWNQGIAYLLAGHMAEGWAQYEWRKRRFPEAFGAPPPGPEWDGAPLAGRTLLVLAEQGFGDTIQLCRYLPPLVAAGAQVVLECAPKLIGLLRCLPGVALIPPRSVRPAYDVWADQMSLPRLFGTRLETIPSPGAYLHADPARRAEWARRLPDGLRIGLVWAGNPAHSNDRRRSAPLAALAPLFAAAPGAFVSLQVGPGAAEAARFGLVDNAAALTDFAETAALVAGLDLVITVDTAVAHLAGALGVPTWVMLPYAPDWRWLLHREDSPWYRSLRLFRQNQPGDWPGVIARVAAALQAVVAGYSMAMPPLTCSVAPVIQPASVDAK